MKDLSKIVSHNLSTLRKARGLTQGQLAERFSYTDKSISKWETGEGLPDINVLAELASFYGVTLDYLIQDHEDETLKKDGKKDPKDVARNKIIVIALGVVFIWTVAAVTFSALMLSGIQNWSPWLCFIWAIPVSFSALRIFSKHWEKPFYSLLSTIFGFWSIAFALYIELGMDIEIGWSLWFIWLIPIPATIGRIFFYRFNLDKAGSLSL